MVFLKSFLNNVGAEISRMTTIASDRSKSDFIGSVSRLVWPADAPLPKVDVPLIGPDISRVTVTIAWYAGGRRISRRDRIR